MKESINDFIKKLQSISDNKRKLPLVISSNGVEVFPNLEMRNSDTLIFAKDSETIQGSINDFIKELQTISEERRKMPLVVVCPNEMEVFPSIKMMWKDGVMFTKDSKVEKMVITWRD